MQTGNSAYYLYELILRKLEQKNINLCQWHLTDINIFFFFWFISNKSPPRHRSRQWDKLASTSVADVATD